MTAFKDASFMPTNNNKEIIPTASFNALTREDIEKLKKEKTSEELIKIMSESNSSWQKKTEYSREKYINQKKRKYEKTFTVVKPTIEIASDIHYTKLNLKMLNLRTDTLAQILSFANIRAGGQVIVVEECHQVLLQAAATRMGGYGRILTGFGRCGHVPYAYICVGCECGCGCANPLNAVNIE